MSLTKTQLPEEGQSCLFPIASINDSAVDLQQRDDGVDHEHVDDIKAAIAAGEPIAAIDIYIDSEDPPIGYIADGWHRYIAYKLAGKKTIPARIHAGGHEAAFKASLSANAKQLARPRRRADIRKAVEAAITKFVFSVKTKKDRLKQTEIAELCATTQQTVSNVLKRLEEERKQAKAKDRVEDTAAAATEAPKPQQIDFFSQLNESFKPVEEGLKEVFNHTFFLNPDITKKDKVDAATGIETKLKQHLQDIRDLKKKLQEQE